MAQAKYAFEKQATDDFTEFKRLEPEEPERFEPQEPQRFDQQERHQGYRFSEQAEERERIEPPHLVGLVAQPQLRAAELGLQHAEAERRERPKLQRERIVEGGCRAGIATGQPG